MRKTSEVSGELCQGPRRRQFPQFMAMLVLVCLFPIICEAGLIAFAQWRAMFGSYWEPRTPILWELMNVVRIFKYEIIPDLLRIMSTGPWKASWTVSFGMCWAMIMGVIFLRRVR
ncbi:MAG: hypothetical protein NVSMB9_14330 [Isosphaeraceae bacterium]